MTDEAKTNIVSHGIVNSICSVSYDSLVGSSSSRVSNVCIVGNVSNGVSDISIVRNVCTVGNVSIVKSVSSVR